MQSQTPKHFVIQLGSLAALYTSITALLVVAFNLINLSFPDPAESWYAAESAQSAVRTGIAVLIVFFPTYLVLTRIANQTRRRETNGAYTTIARWLIYLSLLVAGGVLLGDLVTLLTYFLNGEITTRFLLKVAALFLVVGAAFAYYVLDIRGHFIKRVRHAVYFAAGASVVVITTIILGFLNIETPSEVRESRIDEQQIADLQAIQQRLGEYLRTHDALPADLDSVYTVTEPPRAPNERSVYRYTQTDGGFELCAEFATASERSDTTLSRPYPTGNNAGMYITNPDNWEHEAGEWCFARTVASATVAE